MTVAMKVCTAECKQEKPLDQFYTNKRYTSGLEGACKACMAARSKAASARRLADPDRRQRVNAQRVERYRRQMATPTGAAEKQRKQEAYAQRRPDIGGTYRAMSRYYRHGVTEGQFQQMHAEQDGKCAGCLEVLDLETPRKTHVDHCHATGAIRGLLCNLCNSALGHARDNTETLQRLIGYLEKSRGLR